jgi:hypothetical protein
MPINVSLNWKAIFGKTKTRSQMCYIFTEDGRKKEIEVPVLKGCCLQEETLSGWVMDATNLVQNEDSKVWYQLLNERSFMPIPAITGVPQTQDLKALANQIFKESVTNDLITIDDEERKDKNRQWLLIIFGTPILLAALILGLKVILK